MRAVYDFDRTASNLVANIQEAFKTGREYVINLSGEEKGTGTPPASESAPALDTPDHRVDVEGRFFGLLGITPEPKSFEALLKFGFPSKVEETVIRLTRDITRKGIVGNRRMLMEHMEKAISMI